MKKAICVILTCILILAIDVAAGILGIEAEIAQNKGNHTRLMFLECKQAVPQAYRQGLASAILLILAHAIPNFVGGCANICSLQAEGAPSASRQLAAGTLILSWLVFALAFSMLVVGTLSNSNKLTHHCGLAHRSLLAVGGSLCFVHALFCVSSTAATAATLGARRGAGA